LIVRFRTLEGCYVYGTYSQIPIFVTTTAIAVLSGMTSQNAEAAKSQILHSFTGADGNGPTGNLITDSAGNIYGVTGGGGASSEGTIYKIAPDGTETVLHNFSEADGTNPVGGLVMDKAGNLYGATLHGGPTEWGTFFKLTTDGHYSILYSIAGEADGSYPNGPLSLTRMEIFSARRSMAAPRTRALSSSWRRTARAQFSTPSRAARPTAPNPWRG
jgi:uncharacterized repeat protein (TIGR03803 family)